MTALDPEQAQVAAWRPSEGCDLRVDAPAGSGKTTALVALAVALADGGHANPSSMVLMTFANQPGRELKDRISARTAHARSMRIGTYHGIALRFLSARNPGKYEQHACLDASGASRQTGIPSSFILWRQVVEYGTIAGLNKPSLRLVKTADDVKKYAKYADLLRARGINTPEEIDVAKGMPEDFEEAWTLFTAAKIAMGAWDYADVLADYHAALRQGLDAAEVVAVDEDQDNNVVQVAIATALANNHPRGLRVRVGDGAQAIHRWRGAAPDLFLDATPRTRPNGTIVPLRTISLCRNYRSASPIVTLSNAITHKQPWKIGPPSIAGRDDEPVKPSVRGLFMPKDDEDLKGPHDFVADEIKERIASGVVAEQIAILTRTNAQLADFQAALAGAGVPCAIFGGESVMDSREYDAVLAYAVIAQKDATKSALTTVCAYPKRFLPASFPDVIRHEMSTGLGLLDAIESAGRKAAQHTQRGAMALAADIRRLRSATYEKRPAIIEELLVPPKDKIRKLKDEDSPDEDRPGIIRSACRLLTRHASAGDALRFVLRCRELSTLAKEGSNRPRGKVLLTTAHRFKGQEAERVYLYVEAGTFPHAKAATTEMPDEHRLFYVACTRARDELVLCWKDAPSEYAIRFCKPNLMDGGWVP